MFVDSHCHLDCIDLSKSHDNDLDKLINEARQAQVSHMLCVSIELEALDAIKAIAHRYDDVSYSVGIHPNTLLEQEVDDETLYDLAKEKDCVAIGETGLDYYRTDKDVEWQRQRFRQHIRLSQQLDKPLIIHTRHAADDTMSILKEMKAQSGVMHCFAESWEVAEKALDLGLYISFSGIVTFKNAVELQEVAKRVPLDRMLIETDSPYLAPMPYRGKQNQPAYVPYVAQKIAELRQLEVEEVAQLTTHNFYQLFNLAQKTG